MKITFVIVVVVLLIPNLFSDAHTCIHQSPTVTKILAWEVDSTPNISNYDPTFSAFRRIGFNDQQISEYLVAAENYFFQTYVPSIVLNLLLIFLELVLIFVVFYQIPTITTLS